jgi:tRNA(Ile2) C34 agmatinyltransferase TiaS
MPERAEGKVMLVLGIVLVVVGIPMLLIPIIGIPMIVAGTLLVMVGFLKGGARLGLGVGKLAVKGAATAGRASVTHATTKRCPDCAGRLPNAAKVCLRCGYRYSPSTVPSVAGPRDQAI